MLDRRKRLSSTGHDAECVSFAAADIENVVAANHSSNRVIDRLENSAIEESSSRGHRFSRIAGLPRSAILRLQEIDVAAARDIERMSARADGATLLACERRAAVAHGAEKLRH